MAQQPPKPPSDGVRPPRHPMYGNSPTSPTSPLRATTATPAGASLEDLLTKDDQAERGLLLSMEERRTQFQTAGGDAWHASVAGERPPLGGAVPLDRLLPPPIVATTGHHQRMSSINTSNSHVSRNSHASRNSSMGSSRSSQHSVTKLADIARRMRQKTAAADGRTLSGTSGAPQQQQQQQQHLGGVNGNTASSFNENSVLSSITGIESHNATSSNLYHRRAPSRAHALLDSIQEQPDNQDGGVDSIFDSVGGSGNNTGEPDNQTGGAPSDLNQTMTHTDHLLTGAMQVEELFDDTLAIPPPISSSSIVPPEKNAEGSLEVQDLHEDINNTRTSETTPLNAPYHNYQYSVDSVIGDGVNMALDDPINNHVSDTHKSNSSHASTSKGQTNSHSVPHSHKKTSPMMMNAKHARQKAANNKKRSKLLLWALCHPWLLVQSIIRFLWHQTILFSVTLPCVLVSALFFYVLSNPTWSFLPGHASVSWWFNFIGRQTILFEVARLWQWCLIDKIVLGTRIAVQCLGPLLTLCFIQARGWPFCIASWGFLDLLLLEGSSNLASHWFWFSNLSMYSQLDSGAYILNSDIYIRLLMSMIVAGIAVAIKRTSVAMSFGRRTFVEFKPRLEKLLKEVVLVSELAALAEEAELAASEELMEVQVDNKEQQRVTNVKFMGDVSWSNNNRRRDGPSPTKNAAANENTDSDDDNDDDDDESDDEDSEITTQNDILPERQSFRARQLSSTSCVLQGLLDHWEEPINKADKSLNASISDILRFRRALTFMDDDLMFGETFGPASTREQLINSAHRVYNRLLMLTPGREKVSCEFYDMLAQEDNGKLNNKKRKALRKLFRPNGANEISLLAFVRSCDALYKKLRYFRANVGNASIIDHALESIVDGAFGFILALVLLSVMRVNPWPLLVSISTLLVSISFAVGSSASKWFEGMLLVAARRPFDLGDRIYMTDPSLVISDGLWYCWFVEDINLFHTTVRYAGTNEVATINNGSVANMRIINGARSPNAAVWFQFAFRPNLMEDGNMDNIKAALEGYARDNPQNWHSFGYFRVDEVHPDVEKLVVTIGMQHRSSWQDLVRILESKASIMCWLMEYCRKLGVLYDELPKRELMYYAGDLKEGGVRQHRFQLHGPTNITNGGFNNLVSPPHSSVPNSPIPTGAKPKTASDATFLERLKHSHG